MFRRAKVGTIHETLSSLERLPDGPQEMERVRAEQERTFQDFRPGLGVRYLGDRHAAALGEFAIRNRSMKWKQTAALALPDETPSSLFMVIVGTGLGGGGARALEIDLAVGLR